MRRVISLLVIARLIQRLLNGGRRGPGMGSWNQNAGPGQRPAGTDKANAEPPQGGPTPAAQGGESASRPAAPGADDGRPGDR